MPQLDLRPGELEIVLAILASQIPEYEVRAFGSRIRGTSTRVSDLDLVIMTEAPLSTLRRADLKEAFSESNLPFKVDVVDWAATGENFRKIIENQMVVIKEATR
jgi:predicted nucleotidyltransferase